MSKKTVVGLALGSGAARGLAHIGVLKALEELNIDIDIISGSSAGALIGGLYSTGIDPDMLKNLTIQIDKKMWMDFTVPRKGIIKGERIEEILKLITANRNIEELNKKLVIVATDLKTGEEVIFNKGPLYKAIRASISIPGVFEPVEYQGRTLVDGGVVDRIPISILKKMGADIVIAIDVGFSKYQSKVIHMFDIVLQSIDIMSKQITEPDLGLADLIIRLPLSHIESSDFELVEECSIIGYETVMKNKEKIFNVLNNLK
ncbi:NTE family protein [Keratinibaculum paraultunense]|uniref:NTE family protein n=1 Tax=Keratinibaculum paraultunense TaxID=1278232 RepID=A0A4R3KWA9_9FIRM|nr:patatin-like phospholipase family protein [Keratinibaculum paraultunense]TCS89620.1 NTE family protein [Keratinibaculum paraultunense]